MINRTQIKECSQHECTKKDARAFQSEVAAARQVQRWYQMPLQSGKALCHVLRTKRSSNGKKTSILSCCSSRASCRTASTFVCNTDAKQSMSMSMSCQQNTTTPVPTALQS